jgi:hypothetical protein
MSERTGVSRLKSAARPAESVTWRRVATGGWQVDHHRRGGGFTRVHLASEADAQAYADGLAEADR